MAVLIGITALLTHFPMPESLTTTDLRQMAARQNMRSQTIWFFFLVVTGFSLAIEPDLRTLPPDPARQELAAQKDRAELALYKAQINPALPLQYAQYALRPDPLEIGPRGVRIRQVLEHPPLHVCPGRPGDDPALRRMGSTSASTSICNGCG